MFKFLKKKKTTKKTLKSPREDILDNMRNNLKEIDNFDKFTEVVVPLTGVHYHEDFCIDDIKKKSESAMKELSEEIIDHFGSRHPTKFSAITQYYQIPMAVKKQEAVNAAQASSTNDRKVDQTGFNIIQKLWYSCY